jgi:hypothetical protein
MIDLLSLYAQIKGWWLTYQVEQMLLKVNKKTTLACPATEPEKI